MGAARLLVVLSVAAVFELACGDAARNTGTPTPSIVPVAAEPASIAGTVIDRQGRPLSGYRVSIGGTETTTDASGVFNVTATPPYDVALHSPDPASTSSVVYQGLTSDSPTLVWLNYVSPVATHATEMNVRAVLDPATPFDPNDVTHVVASGPEGMLGGGFEHSADYVAQLPLNWWGDSTIAATVLAYRIRPNEFGDDEYLALEARSNAQFHDGQPQSLDDFILKPAQTQELSFNLELPSAVQYVRVVPSLKFGDTKAIELSLERASSGQRVLRVPVVDGATNWLRVSGTFPSGTDCGCAGASHSFGIASELTRSVISVRIPPVVYPGDGGQLPIGEIPRWSFAGSATCIADLGDDLFRTATYITHGRELRIDPTAFALASGRTYSLQVECFASIPDVDAATSGQRLRRTLLALDPFEAAKSDYLSFSVQ